MGSSQSDPLETEMKREHDVLLESETRNPKKCLCLLLSYWLRTECDFLAVPTELTKLVTDFAVGVIHSTILSYNESHALCESALEKCGVDLVNCELLFRGSEHGFAAAKFHELCDGKGATLTVVQTEFGQVIGGFTTVPWTNYNCYKKNTGTWLFVSRVNESKRPQYSGVTLPAILKANTGDTKQVRHHPGYGPLFGNNSGWDLLIANDCDANTDSFCHCTGAYVFSNVCDGVTLSVLAITGGTTLKYETASYFRVVDFEVFSVA